MRHVSVSLTVGDHLTNPGIQTTTGHPVKAKMLPRAVLTLVSLFSTLPGCPGYLFGYSWGVPVPNQPDFPNHPRNILSDRADNATENRTRTVETAVPCDTDKSCGGGKYCDRHYGVCKPRGRLGDLCRRDGNCQGGYDCMFGRCEKTIQAGEQGARCKHDKDCGDSMCCARQHGERICKRRLVLDQKCYVPDGGLDYSLNQMCPCEKGLICGEVPPPPREEEFILFTDNHHMRCKAIDE
ncbi:hypothetical protein Bbelb_063160 [Branchiostoma belcheri]|nr:hypothetical protein Bbelb_063160 [Branchiostoma belcheri]